MQGKREEGYRAEPAGQAGQDVAEQLAGKIRPAGFEDPTFVEKEMDRDRQQIGEGDGNQRGQRPAAQPQQCVIRGENRASDQAKTPGIDTEIGGLADLHVCHRYGRNPNPREADLVPLGFAPAYVAP